MSSPFANPLGGGWNWPSWLVRTSAQQPPATATVSAAALSGYDDNDNDEPVAPAAAIKRLGASSPCSPQQQHPSKRLKSDRTEGGRPLEASVLASVLTSATATATASSPQIKLEQVLEAVQEHTEKAQERQARAEERERLANARAERIESLLERVLEKLVDAPERAATNRRRRCSTDRDGGDEEQENDDDDDDEEEEEEFDDEEEEEFDDEEEEESADEASVVEGTNEAAAAAASPRTPTITPRKGQLWTPNEREIVVRGVAIYGKDYKVVSDLLENRNYDQTRGFFRRNDDYIDREISKYPCNNESDKKKLLEDIRRLQQNGEDRVEKNDDDHDDGATLRTGIWSQREYELAAKGLAIHGLNNFDAIATLVRTRTPKQTHRFLMRRYDELREMAKAD